MPQNIKMGADKNTEARHDRCMQVLSISQASEKLCISRSMMYSLLDRGVISSFHIGRRRFVTGHSLNEFIERQEEVENV